MRQPAIWCDRDQQPTEHHNHITIGDIFRIYGPEYRRLYSPTLLQLKVMNAIESCRTIRLGGHLQVCDSCGHETPMYNSCRDRHCPTCQSLAQAKWIAGRLKRVINTHYFHLVFTVPDLLRPLATLNRKLFFDILMKAAARTILTLSGESKHLGAQPGVTVVLHTWTRELHFHPHVHCIVTGGGLSPDGDSWISVRNNYLLPRDLMAALFRGILLTKLVDAQQRGELTFPDRGDWKIRANGFSALMKLLRNKKWGVHAERAFGGPEQVIRYLGRYTHRTGISNQRIESLGVNSDGKTVVRFRTRDKGTIELPPLEFIRRFLLHLLPPGFTKIRHYGLHASGNVNTRLAKARQLCGPISIPQLDPVGDTDNPLWMQLLQALTGKNLGCCPKCEHGRMINGPRIAPVAPASDHSNMKENDSS